MLFLFPLKFILIDCHVKSSNVIHLSLLLLLVFVTWFKNSPRDFFAFVWVGLNLDHLYNTYLNAFSFSGFIFAISTMTYSNTFILWLC